ncbi:TetR/AcrR family transcriptional regulator [Kribbia dieselivorans]|uniref:TetR/AcrR family transcriptional regulator n=1 Tax=Kribbia dieselivorans TaxID=331526 RepID=UPI0012EDD72B|nr:TetR/AcrR family transcriptional regulator [Kribbia dieselivorans]
MPAVPARPDDLTAKARIRNAALALFAGGGYDGTTMRAVATAAGVTVGLVVHHYGTKERLRDAVEDLIVAAFTEATASVKIVGSGRDIGAARDRNVAQMLASNTAMVDYLRRTILDPNDRGVLLNRLADLAAANLQELRAAGLTASRRSTAEQVAAVLTAQIGQLFLQPMVDRTVTHFGESDPPRIVVRLER